MDDFDPYHKWLSIPKHFRPPTHYQLLHLPAEETDPEVIEESALRLTMHLRNHQLGPHAALATRLLNEIAQARITLLDPARRKRYDESLGLKSPKAAPAPPAFESVDDPGEGAITSRPPRRPKAARRPAKPKPSRLPLILGLAFGGGVLAIGAIAAIALVLLGARREPVKNPPIAAVPKDKAPPREDPFVRPRPPLEKIDPPLPLPKLDAIPIEPPHLLFSAGPGRDRIFYTNLKGVDRIYLTDGSFVDGNAEWSPDGTKVAFVSNRSGRNQIHVMDADGKNERRLTTEPVDAVHPAWTPDGKRIAYQRFAQGRGNLVLIGVDGQNPTELGEGFDPAISPDGKKILHARFFPMGYRACVMDIDGTHIKPLQQTDNRFGWVHPAWSPDGKTVAWADFVGGLQIFTADADGENVKQLTKAPGHHVHPTWSPDGKQILFFRSDGKTNQHILMDADGGNPQPLPPTGSHMGNCRVSWKAK